MTNPIFLTNLIYRGVCYPYELIGGLIIRHKIIARSFCGVILLNKVLLSF